MNLKTQNEFEIEINWKERFEKIISKMISKNDFKE